MIRAASLLFRRGGILLALFALPAASVFGADLSELQAHARQCARYFFEYEHNQSKLTDAYRRNPASYHGPRFLGLCRGCNLSESRRCLASVSKDESLRPWLENVMFCEADRMAEALVESNPRSKVARRTLDSIRIYSGTEQCDPLPTPDGVLRARQAWSASVRTPTFVNPRDGSPIAWVIQVGSGIGTVHLGISLSDNSFWRYVYGSPDGAVPATVNDTVELKALQREWRTLGTSAKDFVSVPPRCREARRQQPIDGSEASPDGRDPLGQSDAADFGTRTTASGHPSDECTRMPSAAAR